MRQLVLAVAALTLALAGPLGCIGENKQLGKEDAPRPGATPEPPRDSPWFIFREIAPPPTYENTTRIIVARDGVISLEHGPTRLQDPITPEERAELDSLSQRVGWGKLPTEYLPRATTTPPKNPHTYEISFYGGSAVHTVTTHDGVDNEDESLARLKEKLQGIARRLETGR
jgi:hypothetical protein